MTKNNSNEDNTLGMLAHLLAIFTGFVGPLIIYLLSKENKFAKENARHALNFQISLMIYLVISFILVFVLIGAFLMWFLSIFALIVEIIGTVSAYQGNIYKYPLEIPFIK